jgi:uncharacterized protein YodC (DUF2158 family)
MSWYANGSKVKLCDMESPVMTVTDCHDGFVDVRWFDKSDVLHEDSFEVQEVEPWSPPEPREVRTF